MATIHKCGFIAGCSGIGKFFGCGAVLEEYFPVKIFTTGDWCRLNAAIKAASGILVDDDLIQQACEEYFRETLTRTTGKLNLLVDAPRSKRQFYAMSEMFNRLGGNSKDLVTFCLHSDEEHVARSRLYERANRKARADDTCPKTVEKRIDTCYGSPIDPESRDKMVDEWVKNKEDHLFTPRNIPRNTDGLVHNLFPVLRENTNFKLINADCMDTMRNEVQFIYGPQLLG